MRQIYKKIINIKNIVLLANFTRTKLGKNNEKTKVLRCPIVHTFKIRHNTGTNPFICCWDVEDGSFGNDN